MLQFLTYSLGFVNFKYSQITVPEKSLERFFEKPTKRKNDTFLCFSFIERNNTGNKHHAPPTWSKLQQLP